MISNLLGNAGQPRRCSRTWSTLTLCFWEDDGLDLDKVDQISGPNHLTLREGRQNFRNLGAFRVDMQPHVLEEGSRARYRYAPRQP
jgi:Cysteine-rich CPCC